MAAGIHVRILIVDDDEALSRRLRAWLEAARYDVAAFSDPDEGLQYATRVAHDVALVDLRLSDRDGAEVIEALSRGCPRTRVLALTAFPEGAQVIRALRAGARDVLEKPIAEATLLRTLEQHLEQMGLVARDEGEFNRRLGRRLRTIRQADERTLEQVAEAGGITSAQLSQIELGKTATSTWTLARISAALRIPLARLFQDL